MTIDPRHGLIKRLFAEAVALPGEAREGYLAGSCDDPALRAEVLDLLRAHDQADTGFLAEPPRMRESIDESRLGLDRGWQVLRELARGGMGVVYLAERADGAYQQQVALKLLAPGVLPDAESQLRLKLERQILARLDHPNIARLLDGGTTEHGVPYLVMEYVEGERIDRWSSARQLDLRARVLLFLKVCDAVAYAHRNLVVHRDIKPGNILVRDDGEPKLLDFGIAKRLDGQAEMTSASGQLLTPRYASPEQVRGEPVSTLSDVYSLGVVLYELLTGRSPYGDAVETPPALARAVCESDARAPSTTGRAGGEPLPVRPGLLRGDLDAVVLACLRKRPADRYASVEALSQDLLAWLEGRAVAARRGGAWYRVRRFAQRHWLSLGVAAGVLALVLGFNLRLAAQLEQTRIERDKGARMLAFVTDLFRVADPGEARGSSVTVREILDRGAEVLQQDHSLDPPARVSLLGTLAAVYRQLGLLAPADALLDAALQDAEDDDAVRLHLTRAGLRTEQGRFDEARAELDRAAELLRSEHAEARLLQARLVFQRGDTALRQGRLDEAEPLLREALAQRVRLFGPQAREVAEVRTSLGSVLRDRGRLDAAEAEYSAALDALKHLGWETWDRAKLTNNLAIVAGDRGRFDEAEARFVDALELIEQAVGSEHALVAAALGNVASVRMRRGDIAGSRPLFERAHAIRRAALGERHPLTGTALSNLAYVEFVEGEFDLALEHAQAALELQRDGFGPAHPHVLNTLRNLHALQWARGDVGAARSASRELLEQGGTSVGGSHPMLLQARVRLALLDCVEARCETETLASAVRDQAAGVPPGHPDLGESRVALALAVALEDAAGACEAAREAAAAFSAPLVGAAWDRDLANWLQARCEASGNASAALVRLQARFGAGHPLLRRLAGMGASHAPD